MAGKHITFDKNNPGARERAQEKIWEFIREQKRFTTRQIWPKSGASQQFVIQYLKRLELGGFVARSNDFDTSHAWVLVNEDAPFAPRLKSDGAPVKQNSSFNNMWQAMRILKEFSSLDIALHATTTDVDVTPQTAQSYCSMLFRHGYLRVMQRAHPPGRMARYFLSDNTGPLPPRIQRVQQVFDLNEGRVRPNAEGGA